MCDIDTSPEAIWSLLLMPAYLTARSVEMVRRTTVAELVIPNLEPRVVFEDRIWTWAASNLVGEHEVDALARARLEGDTEPFGELLSEPVVRTLSCHSTGRATTESTDHAFMLKMLVHPGPRRTVRSVPESGLGRYDVAVAPKQPGKPGVVLGLERLRTTHGETAEASLDAAIEWVRERRRL